jgi:CHAD domain-containing protein
VARVGDSVEVEWQFDALDLRPVERWLASLPTLFMEADEQRTITALAKTPRRMVDSYLDTDEWRMLRAGFVVRTRHRGRHDEVTLKDMQSAGAGGLRQRLEVTEKMPEGGVAALGPDGPVGRRVHAVAGRRPLRPVLQVRTRRRPFALRVGGTDAAEVALDDTMIVVGNGQRPMHLRRVEVEVLPGWLEVLAPVVQQLRAACGLQPATLSKFEAGLLALGAVIPGPPDLGPTDISPEATMGELAYAVLRRQVAVLVAKEPGTRLGEDVEELHDMRVATRRLRAALDLFVEVLPVRSRHFRSELKWMAAELGHVRDLDVQLEGHQAMADSGPADPLAELTALLGREREAARADLLASLDSVRWERLLSGLSAMVQQGPLRRSAATRQPGVVAMPELVTARHAAVANAARKAKRSGEAADFHRLRIRCKRLRYSLEFSSELYAGRTGRYVRRLTGLQDKLGLLQDAEVAASRLFQLATEEGLAASTIFLMGGVAERHHRKARRLLRILPEKVARVGGHEWRELAATMERSRIQALALVPPSRQSLRALPGPDTASPVNGTEDSEATGPPMPPLAVAPDVSPVGGGESPA